MSLLGKIGEAPQRSVRIFILGLVLFVIGLIFVFIGYYNHHYWQMLGMVFLGLGIVFAIWGYIGIFASRLLTMFNRHPK